MVEPRPARFSGGEVFQRVCAETAAFAEDDGFPGPLVAPLPATAQIGSPPYLTEPWYCCAEPVDLPETPPTTPPV